MTSVPPIEKMGSATYEAVAEPHFYSKKHGRFDFNSGHNLVSFKGMAPIPKNYPKYLKFKQSKQSMYAIVTKILVQDIYSSKESP